MSDKSVATMIEKTSDQITPMLHVFFDTHCTLVFSRSFVYLFNGILGAGGFSADP